MIINEKKYHTIKWLVETKTKSPLHNKSTSKEWIASVETNGNNANFLKQNVQSLYIKKRHLATVDSSWWANAEPMEKAAAKQMQIGKKP